MTGCSSNKTMKTTFETIFVGLNGINYYCLFFCDRFVFAKNVLEFKLPVKMVSEY